MKTVSIGNWKLGVGEDKTLHPIQVKKMERLVEEWSNVESSIRKKDKIQTWVMRNLNIPTILCRIDIAPFEVYEKPKKKMFEIEARPAGFGILLKLFPKSAKIKTFWKELGEVGAIVLKSRKIAEEDTHIFSQQMGWKWIREEYGDIPKRLWVRGSMLDSNDVNLTSLEHKAIAPITTHGDKTYLLHMNLATEIGVKNVTWDMPFVIKPLKGSKGENVLLWNPEERKKKTQGLYTKTKIIKTLSSNHQFIHQPFILPQKENHYDKEGFTIWRIYFAYNISKSKWEFAGGLWNWRPCLKIHGASDSIVGVIK